MNTMKMPSDNKFALFYFEKRGETFSHKIYKQEKENMKHCIQKDEIAR